MINKKNLWFLTLFSLILVLSVYYITMPSELLLTGNASYTSKNKNEKGDKVSVDVDESEVMTALRVKSDEEMMKELDALKLILSDSKSTVDEKNEAFEKMKDLNITKAKEQEIENLLKKDYQLDTFVKIDGDQVKIVVNSNKHDITLANNLMRSTQGKFETKKYITVEFKA